MKTQRAISLFVVLSLVTLSFPQKANAYECTFEEHLVGTMTYIGYTIFAGDVDSDGDQDVVTADYYNQELFWYENDGGGNFTKHTISGDDGITTVYATDLDEDGDTDILTSSYYDGNILWYENDGSENFTEKVVTNSAPGAQFVYAIDLDEDNDIDVLSAGLDNVVAWYDNDGSENFTKKNITTSASGAQALAVVDVDRDNDFDVLVASRADDTIAWYENDGSESFTKNTITTSADAAWSVQGGDLDGDGDIDVVSASQADDTVAWYENDGSESFTRHNLSTSADGAVTVILRDMDRDGDTDIVSASYADSIIRIFENNGSATFGEVHITGVRDQYFAPWGIDAADYDGDGDLDIISSTDSFSGDVLWFQQQCPDPPDPPITEGPNTSLDVEIKVDQADKDMSISLTQGVPYVLSSKIPDADQVQEVYLRVNGKKYYFKHSDNDGYYILDAPYLPVGEHNFTVTADWGRTTKTIYGTIIVREMKKTSPFLPLINYLFRTAYNREITMTEWYYWATRLLNMDFPSIPAIFGAMQWQKMFRG